MDCQACLAIAAVFYFVPPTYLYVLHHIRGAQLYVKGYNFQFSNVNPSFPNGLHRKQDFTFHRPLLQLLAAASEAPVIVAEKRKLFLLFSSAITANLLLGSFDFISQKLAQ